MENDFYDNLLEVTNNVDDITTEKYGVITELDGIYCSVKETDNDLEHNNVPILNGANLSVGDKVMLGFLNNSIYDVVCYGALDKTVHDDSKQDLLISGQNIKTINHTSLLGSGNIDIQGGGSDVDIVTSWEPTPSDTKVPSEKLTKDTLDTKVDKVTGKGLSANDFTNSYKNTIDGLSTVATTGDYDDLTDKPTIPSKISDLTNDSDFIEKSSINGLVKNDGTIDTTSYSTFDGDYNNLSNKPTIPSASSTTPSADTSSGSYGSGTSYARSDHTHPKSSLYAEATHTHTKSAITDFPTLATVATSGSYTDLNDKPTIPSKTSELTNDSNFATTTNVSDSITAHNSNTSAHNLNKSQNIAFGTVGGTTSAFTVSLTGVTLTEGTVIALYNAIGSNVANATLNVNGLGAKPLYNQESAIPASRFPNKSVCLFVYNTTIVSTGCWQIIYSYGANSTYSKATTTPIADTSAGAVGTINKYALADHSHPQSSLYAEASHSHTKSQITDLGDYVETSAIANNLTTTSSGYVLDARQGKALADLIGDAIVYINQ